MNRAFLERYQLGLAECLRLPASLFNCFKVFPGSVTGHTHADITRKCKTLWGQAHWIYKLLQSFCPS